MVLENLLWAGRFYIFLITLKMIKIPTDQNGRYSQLNDSDKFSNLHYTENMNLDERGYIKLSPRTVIIAQEAANNDFGVPVAIGRWSNGNYLVATTSNANFDVETTTVALDVDENSGSNEPTLTVNSHGVIWQGLWFASTATAVLSRAMTGGSGAAWTSRITSLTTGVRHYMEVFASRQQLAVSNGNVVKQYDTSYANTQDLTIPSDYEVVGMAYNNSKMGIITRLGSASEGQNTEARFYIWDGATGAANSDSGVGSDACIAVCAYRSTFVILTRAGQLLEWNGGGFNILASFPFYFEDKIFGDFLNNSTFGNIMTVDGDVIYINLGMDLNEVGLKQEDISPNCPSGVWCFDPEVGLYHRWSPSASAAYIFNVTDANVDLATDIMTVSSGTLPATGAVVRMTNRNEDIGGITRYYDYFLIKLSSTTFKLASTRENALAGTAIDLTSKGSGGSQQFWMYDLVDYSTTLYSISGTITRVGETSPLYQDILFGGDINDTSLSSNDSLFMVVPFLESRGCAVYAKIFSSEINQSNQALCVKFRPLKTIDKIIVKARTRDIVGLPVTSSGKPANWTSPIEFYTTQDISEAKAYLDSGGELECKIIAGAGGGVAVKVMSISAPDSGNTSVVLAESVLGAAAGLKAEFIINNWDTLRIITSTDDDVEDNVVNIPLEGSTKFFQPKIELRGYDVTVEEIGFAQNVDKNNG